MSEERRQSLKLPEPGSFDVHKKAATPMIAMLDHLELDMEVLDIGIETTESNNYKEMPMVCWPQYEKEQDFPTKMDRSLLTYLPSQLVNCIR